MSDQQQAGIRVAFGGTILGIASYAALKHLIIYGSEHIVSLGGSGTQGAILTWLLFGLGSYLVATGLFRGIAIAVCQSDEDGSPAENVS